MLQSALHAAPDNQRLGELVCYALSDVPGVSSTAIYIDEKLVALAESSPDQLTQWPSHWQGTPQFLPSDPADFVSLPLQTNKTNYGFLVLLLADQQSFQDYLPHLENTVNLIAVMLENRQQSAELQELNRNLEAQVKDRVKLLQRSEERLSLALVAAKSGLWDWDLKTGQLFFGANYFKMAGYEADEFPHVYEEWKARVHPEDIAQVETQIEDYLAGRSAQFAVEFRFKTKHGQWMWILGQGMVSERDATGAPVRFIGTHTDIDERKQVEEALQESEKIHRHLLENVQVGIISHAADTSVLTCNTKASELLGLAINQMQGKAAIDPTWQFFREDGTVLPLKEYPVKQVIASEKRLENLILGILRPDKKDFVWVLCGAYPLFDEKNRLKQVVTNFIDVTDRKKKEQDLLYREAFEALISGISTRFVELMPPETEQGIDLAIKELGEFAGVDRSYVILFSADGTYMDNANEWCAEGIPCQKKNRQKVAVDELPWAIGELLNKQVLYLSSLADLPPKARLEKIQWKKQGIQSLIAVPILLSGEVVGLLGFEEVSSEKQWGEEDTTLLQTVADILGSTIARQRAESALQAALTQAEGAREKLEAILKSVADGLIFTNMDDRILLMSASTEVLLGKNYSELSMQTLDATISDKNIIDHIQTIKADGENETTMELELKGESLGQEKTLQIKSSLVRGRNGRKEGVITLLRDVSRERELGRMKSEFISTAAHELRTPLTSVLGYAQLLLSEQAFDAGQQADFLSIIIEKAEVLEKIIDDLLNVSRVESGQILYLQKEWQDLVPALEKIVGQYQKVYKTHHFEANLPKHPVELMVDLGKFTQVMENLLFNAVKFSPKESLILVTCDVSVSMLMVSVKDQGCGMTAEQAERVFDKFYRVDSSNAAKEGLGLGMSIVKGIVDAHDGTIWVESELDKGTAVKFTLPLGQ